MKNVIITGADGFVGSYTVKCFLENGIGVLAVDQMEKPRRLEPNPRLTYLQADISRTDEMFSRIPSGIYDTFIHFAWGGSAGPQRVDYELQMDNALNTVACMKAARAAGCARFLCAGTIMEKEIEAAVHAQGNKPGLGYIYGIGKLTAHCLCKAVATDIGIDLIWPMITNAYGIGELSPRFINTTLRKIIANEPLQFTAATQNYDFIYVTDVAQAFYQIALRGKPFCEYVIGSGEARPLKEFLRDMRDEVAPGMEMVFGDIPYTGVDMPLETFTTDDLRRDCGFQAEISFARGTRMVYEWLKTL